MPLTIAEAIVAAAVALRVLRVASMPLYLVAGLALWITVHESGVDARMAGVAVGLLAPARPQQSKLGVDAVA